ncbi:hypothetical protein FUAX_35730 [Fulvitalea axinellae]|uniref:TonB-dependent receptor n=1 Tax=Fulvitalea axinellae TaxID=1182444 RepID=A0AAU9DD94_9BACT|nr:hypothetical protein FUAX_35730 [Fulvitalea axinellae]
MKNLILLLFFCTTSLVAFSQGFKVSGSVASPAGEAIQFVNVALHTLPDSTLITGAVTDANGAFEIKAKKSGSYFLRLRSVGLASTETPAFVLNEKNPEKNLGKLSMESDTQELEAVTVRGQKELVVQKVDRMVINVKDAMLTSGQTAQDVLEKVPGVYTDQDGNMRIVGKSGNTKVMIDGRPTMMSSEELVQMLRSMSADKIKSIEVIRNPSAKYEAEGNSGIIDIKLDKMSQTGLDGSVYVAHDQGDYGREFAGMSLNFAAGKLKGYSSLDANVGKWARTLDNWRRFRNSKGNQTHVQDAGDIKNNKNLSFNIGLDYDINDRQSFGGMFKVSERSNDNLWTIDNRIQNDNGEPLERVGSVLDNKGDSRRLTGNLHYRLNLDSVTTIELNADATSYDMDDETLNETRYQVADQDGKSFLVNPYNVKVYSFMADYSTAFDWAKFEAGGKFSYTDLSNIAEYDSLKNGKWEDDLIQSNAYDYDEYIGSLYFNLSGTHGKLTWQTGLRAEYTRAEGYSKTQDTVTVQRYLKLFPSAFLSYAHSKDHNFGLSYSYRINRPSYWQLNPYPMYLDAYTISQGNPYLDPAYTHSVEANYTLKGKYVLSLSYSDTEGMIMESPQQNHEEIRTYYKQSNFDGQSSFAISLALPIEFTKWWQSSNSLNLSRATSSFFSGDVLESHSRWVPMLQSTQTLLLPADMKAQVSFFYRGKSIWGNYSMDPMWQTGFSIEKPFFKKRLSASLKFSDIFKTNRFRGEVLNKTAENKIGNNFDSRRVKLTLRYKFSKGKQVKVKRHRQKNKEQLNRI